MRHVRIATTLLLTLCAAVASAQVLHVKFADGSDVRLRSGRFVGRSVDVIRVNDVLASTGATARRIFSRNEADLDPEMNLFYAISFRDAASTNGALRTLGTLGVIDFAEPAARPAPPPDDIAPMTPSFVHAQTYRAEAPFGLGFGEAQWSAGGNADGIRIADVEVGWVAAHEDLNPLAIDGYSDPEYADHGAAVTGILAAVDNAYGVSGVASHAELILVSAFSAAKTFNVADAINRATARLRAGDVLLIEQQIYCSTNDLCPIEWDRASAAAIRDAVARGIVVIEPAGNGGLNLDGAQFTDRLGSESGAILVGAGTSAPPHDRKPSSNYGRRVTVQGFGENVTTLGSGDAFYVAGDPRQWYTNQFSGTSSAAAMVAGAAAVVQGVRNARGLPLLSSTQMRDALVATGTPQGGGEHIGPLPNVVAAIDGMTVAANVAPHVPAATPHKRSAGH